MDQFLVRGDSHIRIPPSKHVEASVHKIQAATKNQGVAAAMTTIVQITAETTSKCRLNSLAVDLFHLEKDGEPWTIQSPHVWMGCPTPNQKHNNKIHLQVGVEDVL